MSPTERTPIVIQFYLRYPIGLWEKSITVRRLILRTIFLPMWGLLILLFGLQDRMASTEDGGRQRVIAKTHFSLMQKQLKQKAYH